MPKADKKSGFDLPPQQAYLAQLPNTEAGEISYMER